MATNSGSQSNGVLDGRVLEIPSSGVLVKRLKVHGTADLDKIVKACVQVSVEGAGGLGLEDWIGSDTERPFRSAEEASYRDLLDFVSRNREKSSDAQSFLHYISPWYDWALRRAEANFADSLKSAYPEFADLGKDELVSLIRKAAMES